MYPVIPKVTLLLLLSLSNKYVSMLPIKIIIILLLFIQVDQFDVYREYILNYKIALSTIRKCKASNEQFNNIFSKVCQHFCI